VARVVAANGALRGSLSRRDRVLARRRTARLEGVTIHLQCAGGAEVGGGRQTVGCVGSTTAARGGDEGLRVVCRALLAPPLKHALVGGAQTVLHLAHARLEIAPVALVAQVGKRLEDFSLYRVHLVLECVMALGERGERGVDLARHRAQLLPMRSMLRGKRGVDPAAHLAIPLLLPEVHPLHPHEEAREGEEQRGGDEKVHGMHGVTCLLFGLWNYDAQVCFFKFASLCGDQ